METTMVQHVNDFASGPSPESQLLKFSCLNRIPAPTTRSIFDSNVAAPRTLQDGAAKPVNFSKHLHLGMFEIGRPLGKGKFGRVYLVRHRPSGYICALKVLNKNEICHDGAEVHVRREIEVHSNLKHPGIISFYGWFHDRRRIFLLIEYASGGELYKTLRKEGRFSERRAAKYAAQVAESLRYLHSKNVMHRDLKPENILIGMHGEMKLADFGYSVHAPSNRRETLCGTLDYLPPEMLRPGRPTYNRAVDQWTLGVLTYEFLTGEAPFEDSPIMTKRRIVKGDMKPLPSTISAEAKDFINSVGDHRC